MAKIVRTRARPLAEFIDKCLVPALAAQGFATSDVIVSWSDIVGQKMAEFTQPVRLEWRRKRAPLDPDEKPEPANLVVRVESAFALELQHLTPIVIDRINAYFGWRCVGRLVLKQGPVRRAKVKPPSPPALTITEKQRISDAVNPVEDEALRLALNRLGEAVTRSEKRPRAKRAQ